MFQNRGDGTPVRPINIKDEPLSSPPVASHNTAHLLRTETSDLDAIRTAMDTPRKRHRLDTLLKKSQHEAAQSLASRQSRSKRLAGLPSPSRTENQDPGTQSQHGFRIDMEAAEDLRATSEPLTVPVKQQSQRSGGVLQPLSTNTPTLPHANAVTRAGRKGKQGRSACRIGFLTEDGEPTSDVPHATRSKGPVAKAETHQRLHTLLNQRFTDDRQPLTVRRTPVTAKKRARETKPDAEPASERPARRAKREGSPLPARTPEPINPSHTPPGPIEPEDEPLRARPLHRLTLDDFRVNPASNQNQDYAYTETIRGRDQRRCLPGCTKPACCGAAFRKLIQIAGVPGPPPTSSLQDDPSGDRAALEALLGPDHARALAALPADEQQELLLQARTKAFADKHARHRNVFARPGSPPGFWRTEMPTTQEARADAEEAGTRERERVEERWREACRPGGRISIDTNQTLEAMIDCEQRSHYHIPTPNPHDMHAQNHSAIAVITTNEAHRIFPPSPPPSTSPRPRTVPPSPASDGMSAVFTQTGLSSSLVAACSNVGVGGRNRVAESSMIVSFTAHDASMWDRASGLERSRWKPSHYWQEPTRTHWLTLPRVLCAPTGISVLEDVVIHWDVLSAT
ncbi:hypothetical protein LTR28_006281 [Elasticomyces elasticus]|nr:hypothetical protein LTR28_006281 [Elasticomyces elasticus]